MDITWFLTIISLVGTVFNVNKNIACFYIWFFGDIFWLSLDIYNKTYGRAFLDLVQLAMAIWGIISWKGVKKHEKIDIK
ncbi:MAG: nicotinamide mononucleotide transporter [Candidatus Paraimprobicoccus trichonymphae]|uniref:Nicotinamide mononucleotide transporter n=1 Tax=Candidatus Paraimprobicoccus trichonymphae TaxID=3033793 RepID=A0AA48IA92_9FIRM|nr:MAG: nicotinamide mononucleotide transporter [Candidatus Paraimprobicoccus trichonymphae]